MSYSDFQKRAYQSAWWQAQNTQAWQGAYGGVKDALISQLRVAVKARFPLLAPTDGLAAIGSERGIERMPGETDLAYAERLVGAWDTWAVAGSAFSVLSGLKVAGYFGTGVVIVQQNGVAWNLDTDGNLVVTGIPSGMPEWTFDTNLDANGDKFWNRFGLIFSAPSIPATWTDIQNPPTTATAPTIAEVNLIRRMCTFWRRSQAIFMGVWVIQGGYAWGWPVGAQWGTQWGGAWGAGAGVTTKWDPEEQ